MERADSDGVSEADCASEPIHIPSAIQPHGCLLTLRGADLYIVQASENTHTLLGQPAATLLEQPLSIALGDGGAGRVRDALLDDDLEAQHPLTLQVGEQQFDGLLHRSGAHIVLELELVSAQPMITTARLRAALIRLTRCDSITELCRAAADVVKSITGFERVLLYRFDEDGHGSVIAERVDEGFPEYLGLHYPASDIPPQARSLYLRNWLRAIPDATYVPVRLAPSELPASGLPLDLSDSVLRSVSPVHLEYMRNIGHVASMSISIVVGDRLWGLVSCAHHTGPRALRYEDRKACEVLGRMISLQLEALEALELRAYVAARMHHLEQLEGAMRSGRDEAAISLLSQPELLLDLVHASGAALLAGDRFAAIGEHPGEAATRALAGWLETRDAKEVYATDRLRCDYAAGVGLEQCASGVLALALPGDRARTLLFFRPEVAQTVQWAGEPVKAVESDGSGRLHPRRSFALWREQVQGRARPWHSGELELARRLRRRIIEVDLQQQVERERKAVRARDELVAVVSHDLRNPLGVIQMQASMLLRGLGGSEETSRRLRASSERIQRAVDRMTALIQDLLDLAKIEAGRFELRGNVEVPAEIVEEALVVMHPLAEQRGVNLRLEIEPTPNVIADRDRVYQVLSNLIGNALKFTEQGRSVWLCVSPGQGEVVFTVRDEGPGIPEDQLPHLFERYWQARPTAKMGTGLGLFIARGIVEAHRGRIWVRSVPGQGATFSFSLPIAR